VPGPLDAFGGGAFRSFDTNGDGFISRDEAARTQTLNRRFQELDRNRDGRIAQAELEAASAPVTGSIAAPSALRPVPGTFEPREAPIPEGVGATR
jgi:Ca2+-binding EF-hand superfamily protein